MRTREELKRLVIEAIDNRKNEIMELGDSIFNEPELGYKEFKTADKVKKLFEELSIAYEDEIAITGIKGYVNGKGEGYTVCVAGELDSVVSPLHPSADPNTGAAHCCGHNAMIASLAGVAYALKDTDIMKDLPGRVCLMAIPAEEYVEIGYRRQLISEGKISFIGGKQEFLKLGAFDDVDVCIMQHSFSSETGGGKIKGIASDSFNGFIGQEINFIGRESHAGAAPFNGVNALNAATVALTAINAQRETFKEADYIRVHPIITKGGDLVNVVPADVRLENYVRGATVEGIMDAATKVTRSWHAGADALGAEVEINTLPGYLPYIPDKNMQEIMYQNMISLFGEEHVLRQNLHVCASSDIGDVSAILPTLQCHICGANEGFHSEHFELVDKELSYLGAAKALAMTMIDLLYDDGKATKEVIDAFVPVYDLKTYLEQWGKIGEKFK